MVDFPRYVSASSLESSEHFLTVAIFLQVCAWPILSLRSATSSKPSKRNIPTSGGCSLHSSQLSQKRSSLNQISAVHSWFRYLHVPEPRLAGIADRDASEDESNDFLRKIWGDKLYLAAGGFTREEAMKTADTKGGLVVFGRYFISNVSLPQPSLLDPCSRFYRSRANLLHSSILL